MSDCMKCWETPCRCGYGYREWSLTDLIELRDVLQRLIDKKEKRKHRRNPKLINEIYLQMYKEDEE